MLVRRLYPHSSGHSQEMVRTTTFSYTFPDVICMSPYSIPDYTLHALVAQIDCMAATLHCKNKPLLAIPSIVSPIPAIASVGINPYWLSFFTLQTQY